MESAFIFICQIQKPGQEQKHSTSVSLKQHVVPAGVSITYSKGLYNPLTLSGTIIVDGVVASVHSDWFLDTALNALGVPGWLPVAYQVQLFVPQKNAGTAGFPRSSPRADRESSQWDCAMQL